MSRKEFEEVKGIALKMKVIGQSKQLTPTPIIVVGPTGEVIVAHTSLQAPTMPYVVVAQQQPLRNLKKIEEESAPRKSTRLEKTKRPLEKRFKQTTS